MKIYCENNNKKKPTTHRYAVVIPKQQQTSVIFFFCFVRIQWMFVCVCVCVKRTANNIKFILNITTWILKKNHHVHYYITDNRVDHISISIVFLLLLFYFAPLSSLSSAFFFLICTLTQKIIDAPNSTQIK